MQCENKFLESTCPWTSEFGNLLVRIHFSLVQNGKIGATGIFFFANVFYIFPRFLRHR